MMRYSKRLEENILIKNLDDELWNKYDFVNSLEWANKKVILMKIIDIGQETFYTPRNQETR